MTEPVESARARPGFDWTFWLSWVLVSTLSWVIGWTFVRPEALIGLPIGVLQWLLVRSSFPHASWWIVASAAGWAAGWSLIVLVLPPQVGVEAGAMIGAALGFAQWWVLRRWVYKAGWWIPVSTLGWAVGLSGVLGVSMVGAIAGAATGYAMELLRRFPRK